MRSVLFVIISSIFICSCVNDSNSNYDNGKKHPFSGLNIISLPEKVINTSFHNFGQVSDMYFLKDSILLFQDNTNNGLLSIINFPSKQGIRLGLKGEGPNEFAPMFRLNILERENEKSLIIHELNSRRYSEFNIDKIIKNRSLQTEYKINKNFGIEFFNTMQISNNRYLASGLFKTRFILADSLGKNVSSLGEYPFSEKSLGLAFEVVSMAYQGRLHCNTKKGKAVFVTMNSANIDFINFSANSLSKGKSYNFWPTEFKGSKGKETFAVMSSESKFGYTHSSVSANKVYVLFSGKSIKSHGIEKALTGDEVVVFDWDGKPQVKLHLQRPVNYIAVNDDDSVLYCFEEAEKPTVLAYTLLK